MGDFEEKHYRMVEEAYLKEFGLDPTTLLPWQWVAGRVAIKRMFLEGLTIQEIISAMPEARHRKKWPTSARVWRRIEDVALKNRREHPPVLKVNRGAESLASLLKKRA